MADTSEGGIGRISLTFWRDLRSEFLCEVSDEKLDLYAIDRGAVEANENQWAISGHQDLKERARLRRKFQRLARRAMAALGSRDPFRAVDAWIDLLRQNIPQTAGWGMSNLFKASAEVCEEFDTRVFEFRARQDQPAEPKVSEPLTELPPVHLETAGSGTEQRTAVVHIGDAHDAGAVQGTTGEPTATAPPVDPDVSPARPGPAGTADGSQLPERTDGIAAPDIVANSGLASQASSAKRISVPVLRESKSASYVLRRQGEFWALAFAGESGMVPHLVGLGYIADLLRAPRKEVEALALASSRVGSKVLVISRGIEVADEPAIASVKRELKDRQAELSLLRKENWTRRGQLTEEIEKLQSYINSAESAGPRNRTSSGTVERARTSVTNAINRALKKIRAALPAMADHLQNSIQKGYICIYLPEHLPDWEF